MVRISVAATLAFAVTAFAMPNHPQSGLAARQAAGSQNVGKGDGSQFITGQCASDADCASGCCAKANGQCAAEAVANENGKDGCGFTSAGAGAGSASGKTPTSSAAAASASSAAAAGTKNNKASSSSAAAAGASSAAAAAAGTKNKTSASAAAGAAASSSAAAAPASASNKATAADASKPGSQNVGKGDGSQFITGQCASDADCASGCCAKPKGVCSAQAVSNVDGKQGCGFTGTPAA